MALSHAVSTRSNPRHRRNFHTISLTNSAIASLNSLRSPSLSSPQTSNPSSTTSHVSSNSSSRSVEHIHDCARRYVRYLRSDPERRGDDVFLSRDTSDLFTTAYSQSTQALPLVADQVSLPSEIRRVRLVDLLPEQDAKMISRIEDILLPSDKRREAKSVFLASHKEYISLIIRMLSADMVDFTEDPKVVNGMFCVPKPDGTLRLIIDTRKANAIMVEPPKAELPNPELVAKLEVAPPRPIYGFKDDMKDFYHMYETPKILWPYLALPPVKAGEVDLEDVYGPETLIYPVCKTLPMGWSWSCYLAQTSHEFIVYSGGLCNRQDSISKHNDNRLDRVRHGIYIDDFFGLGDDKGRLTELRGGYLSVMQSVGHLNKVSKGVPPTCDGITLIGIFVHGTELTVGLHPSKLHKLVQQTKQVIERLECTGLELPVLIGLWTWACLVRRPAFAVFSAVYRYIEVAGAKKFTLWPTVRKELRVMMGLAPLLFVSIADEWATDVYCTDSSSRGFGVVAASFPGQKVSDCARLTAPKTDTDIIRYALPSFFTESDWATRIAGQWHFDEHINVLEARALELGVRDFISRTAGGKRVLMFSDSLVVLFAANKGRSPSYSLLRRLRSLAAYVLASGIRLVVVWVPTDANPADAPSRQL